MRQLNQQWQNTQWTRTSGRIANLDSRYSLRFILVDEATIQGNINCAVVNKDAGMLSHDLKLSWACLGKEDKRIGTEVVARSKLVSTTKRTLLQLAMM